MARVVVPIPTSHAKSGGVIAFTFLVRHTLVESCLRHDQGEENSASLVKRGVKYCPSSQWAQTVDIVHPIAGRLNPHRPEADWYISAQ